MPAVREHDALFFEHAPFPTVGLLGGLLRIDFHSLLKYRIPWSQGKTQGISPIQPLIAKIRLENIC